LETIRSGSASDKMVSMKTTSESIARIEELLAAITARFADEDPQEQEWLRSQCSPAAQRALDELSVAGLHLLDQIPGPGSAETVNIVGLSQISGVPKGTVSKTVQRLESAGTVSRHRLPGNRKEVHLRLTEVGVEIQRAHRGLHEQMGSSLSAFLGRYSDADLEVLTRVLGDLLAMPREGLRFRPDLLP